MNKKPSTREISLVIYNTMLPATIPSSFTAGSDPYETRDLIIKEFGITHKKIHKSFVPFTANLLTWYKEGMCALCQYSCYCCCCCCCRFCFCCSDDDDHDNGDDGDGVDDDGVGDDGVDDGVGDDGVDDDDDDDDDDDADADDADADDADADDADGGGGDVFVVRMLLL